MGFRNAFNGLPPSSITADLLADGSVIGSKLAADAIDGKTITGAHIRTAASGKRWELDSTPANELRGYSGDAAEVLHGRVAVDADEDYAYVRIETPTIGTEDPAMVHLGASVRQGGAALPADVSVYTDMFGVWGNSVSDAQSLTFDTTTGDLALNGSTALRYIDFGRFVGTASGGFVSIPHGVPASPKCVQVSSVSAHRSRVTAAGGAFGPITVEVRNLDGDILAPDGQSVIVYWLVLA